MQVCKTRAIGIDGEYSAIARTATIFRRPIQGIAQHNQFGMGVSSIAISATGIIAGIPNGCCETMQVRKTSAVGIDGEKYASTGTAAVIRRPIQGVAR
jgi:hypothetical protein